MEKRKKGYKEKKKEGIGEGREEERREGRESRRNKLARGAGWSLRLARGRGGSAKTSGALGKFLYPESMGTKKGRGCAPLFLVSLSLVANGGVQRARRFHLRSPSSSRCGDRTRPLGGRRAQQPALPRSGRVDRSSNSGRGCSCCSDSGRGTGRCCRRRRRRVAGIVMKVSR